MASSMVVSMAATPDAFSEWQELLNQERLKMSGFVAAEMTPHL